MTSKMSAGSTRTVKSCIRNRHVVKRQKHAVNLRQESKCLKLSRCLRYLFYMGTVVI